MKDTIPNIPIKTGEQLVLKMVKKEYYREGVFWSWFVQGNARLRYTIDNTTWPIPGTKLFAFMPHGSWSIRRATSYDKDVDAILLCRADVAYDHISTPIIVSGHFDSKSDIRLSYSMIEVDMDRELTATTALCRWITPIKKLSETAIMEIERYGMDERWLREWKNT